MKKFTLFLMLVFAISIQAFTQSATPSGQFRIATVNTAFGIDIAVGTEIICVATNALYICKTATASTLTLTTGSANFDQIGANAHAAVTIPTLTAHGLQLNGQSISCDTAYGGHTGTLRGTDWTTFNNKQAPFTSKVENFTEATAGNTGTPHTLTGTPAGDVVVTLNGMPLTVTTQYTIVTTTLTVIIPVYQYDRVQIAYKYY